MCRRNQLLGIGLLALGIGLVLDCWIDGEFFRNCLGIILVGAGLLVLCKK